MNPYSGDIEYFDGLLPRGWLELSAEEAAEMMPLSAEDSIKRYMQLHADDTCGACGGIIKNHSLTAFTACAADAFARLEAQRQEASMKEFFDSLPVRKMPTREDLYDALEREKEKLRAGAL